MTLQLVTVTATFYQITGSPATGNVVFQPDSELSDVPDGYVYGAEPVTAVIGTTALTWVNGQVEPLTPRPGWFSIPLLPTDNSNVTPAGWQYNITVEIDGDDAYTVQRLIPLGSGTYTLVT